MEGAISVALQSALFHLDNSTHVRMLLINFSTQTHHPLQANDQIPSSGHQHPTRPAECSSFNFLVVHLSEDISRTFNTSTLITRLFSLRGLKKVLRIFNCCTFTCILLICNTGGYGNYSDQNLISRGSLR